MNYEKYFIINKYKLYNLIKNAKQNVEFYKEYYQFVLPSFEEFSYEFFKKIFQS